MKLFCANKISSQEVTPYATSENFCEIFTKDMNRLYQLSFLLAGDTSKAEECFVSGLGDSLESSPVFKEWAESWARRTIIRNAIRMVRPRPTENPQSSFASDGNAVLGSSASAEIGFVAGLPAFERFVFVMSVLDRYSDQECSLLLDCTRADVTAARVRALQRMGKSAEFHKNQLQERDVGHEIEPTVATRRLRTEDLGSPFGLAGFGLSINKFTDEDGNEDDREYEYEISQWTSRTGCAGAYDIGLCRMQPRQRSSGARYAAPAGLGGQGDDARCPEILGRDRPERSV